MFLTDCFKFRISIILLQSSQPVGSCSIGFARGGSSLKRMHRKLSDRFWTQCDIFMNGILYIEVRIPIFEQINRLAVKSAESGKRRR